MKINKLIVVVMVIIGLFVLFNGGVDFLSVLPQSSFFRTTILTDQSHSFIFTEDSQLVNVECPGINPAAPNDANCGGTYVIFLDNKVYGCSGMQRDAFTKMCRFFQDYPEIKDKCVNPVLTPSNQIDYNYDYCASITEKFGIIVNPLAVGDHEWEFASYRIFPGSDTLVYSTKTVTIIPDLQCGDNICSYDRNENNLNCPADCTTSSCFNGIQDGAETGIDCGGSCSAACNPNVAQCTPSFSYGSWGNCINGIQTRTYSDSNSCSLPPDQELQRSCIDDKINNPTLRPKLNGVVIGALIIGILILLYYILKKRK